jgi:N-acetylmuramoyl-L-alanine amidase
MLKWLWRVPVKRKINKVIIHCSATKPSMDIDAEVIRGWHLKRGWKDIGYHFVIKRDGEIEDGRDLDGDGDIFEEIGAHTVGYNKNSIGICLVGGVSEKNVNIAEDNFTDMQWRSLRNLLKIIKADYKKATIHGHNEFANKACPSFDVQDELTNGRLSGIVK